MNPCFVGSDIRLGMNGLLVSGKALRCKDYVSMWRIANTCNRGVKNFEFFFKIFERNVNKKQTFEA
jgi:hypothetical protein